MDAATLRAAMQETYVSDAVLSQYLPYFLDAMKAAEITTELRAAAWCSQLGHESAGLKYMAEIQTSDPSWSEDRTRYRGRGPIQLTWSSNYRKFGQWCKANGYVDDSELFVNQPELVEQPKWGFLASSWYWLKAGPRPGQINSYADAGDILAVSRCINGWIEGQYPNGWADRQARWNRCLALGDALLDETPSNPGGPVPVSGDPVWLEDVLRPALGDRLKTLPGWKDRGHGDFKDIRGVMVHHTGNSAEKPESIAKGRPDLAGPLANIHIAPNGIVTIVAVGVCWHAGAGSYPWLPTNNANWHMIGVECAWPDIAADGSYDPGQRWPDAQIIAMRDTCAALVAKLDVGADYVIGHKEYAGAAQGKWDPGNIDMDWFRGEIQKDIDGVFDGPSIPQPPDPTPFQHPSNDQMLKEIWDQMRGPEGKGWPQLGGLTLVDAIAKLLGSK